MKRTLFLTIVFTALLFTGRINAQTLDTAVSVKDTLSKVSFGVKVGGMFNQVTGTDYFQQGFTPGVFGGFFIESTKKKKRWGIQAEALFNSARYNLQNDSGQNGAYFTLIYVNILVLPEYKITDHLWLQFGPEVSTFVSVNRNPSQSLDAKNYFQSPDFSGVVGLEAKLAKHFTAGARYMQGFSNIRNGLISNTSQSWVTSSAQVYVGYRFQ